MAKERVYLHPPAIDDQEIDHVIDVLKSGWVSTVGSVLDHFERDLEMIHADKRVLALNSGTSALHLGLRLAGITTGDRVGVSSLTFCASANVVLYEGAIPVFFDSEGDGWNLDPVLLEEYLTKNHLKALILTHLFGMPAQIKEIRRICMENGVLLIEDAAEALGATYDDQAVGTFGAYGALSFNGNKIVTTSSGGALICDEYQYEEGLKLASQAKEPGTSEYHHLALGYNYRLSNVLAGIGVAQLRKLPAYLARKQDLFQYYADHLPGKYFQLQASSGRAKSNHWLTGIVVQETVQEEISPSEIIEVLEKANIEARHFWKPMHLQPLYQDSKVIGGGQSEWLFKNGICLPSGAGLSQIDQDRIVSVILEFLISRGLS